MADKRKRLTRYRFDEFSAVTKGAQEAIGEVFLKRDEDEAPEVEDREEVATEDNDNAAGDSVGSADEDNPAELSAQRGDMSEKQENGQPAEAQLAKAQTERDDAVARAEHAEAIVKLTPDQRAHYETLDEAGQSEFLKADESARNKELAKAADANPVVYDGPSGTFRKSDDQRLVEMAKRADEQAEELAKSRERLEQAEFQKRADEEFNHLAGKSDVRGRLVGLIEKHGGEDREEFFSILKANAAGLEAATKSFGVTSPADAEGPGAQLEALAKKLQEADTDLTFAQAFAKAAASSEGRKLQLKIEGVGV